MRKHIYMPAMPVSAASIQRGTGVLCLAPNTGIKTGAFWGRLG